MGRDMNYTLIRIAVNQLSVGRNEMPVKHKVNEKWIASKYSGVATVFVMRCFYAFIKKIAIILAQ